MAQFRVRNSLLLVLFLILANEVSAEQRFRYPEAKYGQGELRYIGEIPVLTVAGSPEEMGEQYGVLVLRPASGLKNLADGFIKKHGWETIYSAALKTGNALLPFFPREHARELEAAAKSSESWPRELLIFGNTVGDMQRILQCSTFIVDGQRSETGGPLFGRNLDWPPFGPIEELTLVVIYRPTGKRAFASITYPALLGCSSGINDAGLALAALDVYASNDGSSKYVPTGTPTMLALRRTLEECATVDEAAKFLQGLQRASIWNVAICDKTRGAVLEITPKNVIVRPAAEGISICTNHFRSPELATKTECSRYATLERSVSTAKYSISDIAQRMDSVNQGAATLQTMIFEPATLKVHLAFGKGPATRLPRQTLNLAELMANPKATQ